jgi:hypothetical protein
MSGYGSVLKLKDLARGVTLTPGTFDATSNLENATDGDNTTTTGDCYKVMSGSGNVGTFTIDLGSVKKVLISSKYAVWTTAGTITMYWDYKNASGDSYTTYSLSQPTTTTSSEPAITAYREMPNPIITARYIQLRIGISTAATTHIKLADFSILEV